MQRFLRGATSSGAKGGTESHNHDTRNMAGGTNATGYNEVREHLPPYYEVVWIMRVK
jgi:hypothetical protein